VAVRPNESAILTAIQELSDTVKDMRTYMVTRFDAVEKRMDGLEKRVDGLEKRMDGLEKRMDGLEKTMSRFDAYMKTEAKIQEGRDTQFIIKLYYHNHPTHIVDRLPIREFYRPNNNPLTDYDGLLLIRNVAIPWTGALQPMDVIEYVIIESKHSLDKEKIDKKIKQITELSAYLGKADDEKFVESSGPRFQESLQKWTTETRLPLDSLQRPIHLLFASDDISHEVGLYLKNISEGFANEAQYDAAVYRLFQSDPYVRPVMERIRAIKDGRISKATHRLIHPGSATMRTLREAFSTTLQHFLEQPIKPYLVPYSDLEDPFRQMKGRIGMSQFGIVEHSPLFPVKGLNRNM
jgi:hypothetical protein